MELVAKITSDDIWSEIDPRSKCQKPRPLSLTKLQISVWYDYVIAFQLFWCWLRYGDRWTGLRGAFQRRFSETFSAALTGCVHECPFALHWGWRGRGSVPALTISLILPENSSSDLYLCGTLMVCARGSAHIILNCGAGLFRASVARDGCHLFPTAD